MFGYSVEAGFVGDVIFLIVSGACLEYAYGHFNSLPEVTGFYKKRLLRIYPVFWASMIFTFLLDIKHTIRLDIQHIIVYMLGLQLVFCFGYGPNISTWFIGLIVMLYLLYPAISYVMNKNLYVIRNLYTF